MRPKAKVPELTGQFNKIGLHLAIHPSVQAPTEAGGLHCGVMIASCRGCPIAESECYLPAEITRPPRERFLLTVWNGALPNGILLGSTYLISGKVAGPENLDFLS